MSLTWKMHHSFTRPFVLRKAHVILEHFALKPLAGFQVHDLKQTTYGLHRSITCMLSIPRNSGDKMVYARIPVAIIMSPDFGVINFEIEATFSMKDFFLDVEAFMRLILGFGPSILENEFKMEGEAPRLQEATGDLMVA